MINNYDNYYNRKDDNIPTKTISIIQRMTNYSLKIVGISNRLNLFRSLSSFLTFTNSLMDLRIWQMQVMIGYFLKHLILAFMFQKLLLMSLKQVSDNVREVNLLRVFKI